jgi:hypothetical protein
MHLLMKEKDNHRIRNLVAVIREGIDRRGFYILLDDRAKLICGEDGDGDLRQHAKRIAGFAGRNGWDADIEVDTIMFWRSESPVAKMDGFPSEPLFAKDQFKVSR